MATFTVILRKDLKNPTYQYDIRDPSLPSGKLRKGGFKGKTEARLAAQDMIKKIDMGLVVNNDITFLNYYNSWLEAQNKKNLSPGAYNWYCRSRDLYVKKYGERKLLKNVTRQELQSVLNEYADGRTKASVKKMMNCLSKPLKDATYEGLIHKDPTYNLKNYGNIPSQRPEDKYLSLDHYFKLIEFFKSKSDKSYILLFLLSITGARFSEGNRMTKEDLYYKLGEIYLPGTKTDTSPRAVELSVQDIDFIKSQLKHHPERFDGKLFDVSNTAASKVMKLAQKTIGIKEKDYVTIYALRHTHASYLISEQFDIPYISQRLGHANTNTTLKVYTHLLDEQKVKEGKRIRSLSYK